MAKNSHFTNSKNIYSLAIQIIAYTVAWGLLATLGTSAAFAQEFLDPEIAFKVEAKMATPSNLQIRFTIADGYYLYRERFKFEATGAELGKIEIPPGKIKFDENFQKNVETFHNRLEITIPIKTIGKFELKLTQQGCADAGLCYQPMELRIPVEWNPNIGSSDGAALFVSPLPETTNNASEIKDKEQPGTDSFNIASALKSGKLALILPLFLILGLGLSLTPCVLPMVPILSYIIVGEGAGTTRRRSFLLSLSYVLGMALIYTGLGIAAGLLGEGLSATLQNPWVLSTFSFLMLVLSLSMFGVFQVQMPTAIQEKLTYFSEGQRNGKLAGVFLMGALSALIVGPCVAAPLAGALVYISQTKDVVVGGMALFAMALGMGVPLLLVGLSAGSLLPRAGTWMEQIKRFFGVLMLAMAIWIASPIVPVLIQMLAWATLLLGYGIYQFVATKRSIATMLFATIFIMTGALQLVGVITGGRDVWSPLVHLNGEQVQIKFQRIQSTSQLEEVLRQSKDRIVMLDFYADWCVSCKEMEKLTFVVPTIKAKLNNMLLLQVDVTKNSIDDKALLKRFGLFGPPGIIFFDKFGREIVGKRVIGYQNSEKFLASLSAVESH